VYTTAALLKPNPGAAKHSGDEGIQVIDSIGVATAWGALAASGIVAGALLGVFARLSHSAIARAMAVGAGLLLGAATVELAADVIEAEPYLGMLVLLLGAAGFSVGNACLAGRGAQHRKRCGECVAQPSEAEMPNSGLAIALGTAMDAVPEALVLGLVLHSQGPDAALIAAIALGNLPEAMSASAGMRAAKRSVPWILRLWMLIAVATTVLTGAGFALAGVLTERSALLLQAFGAGALVAMVSETLLPEAVHKGPAYSGLITAIGFAALLLLTVLL
jgi:zinc transporter, ZIP family